MPTLKALTLGCKVNQYETEYVRQGLLRAGFREVREDEPADLCVVNTCTVTGEGDYKSRKLIRQLARENPLGRIIVMGCYATRAPAEVAALPGVVEVVTDKRQLPELLKRWGLAWPVPGISSFGRMQRAYVKVQDGCRMPCSYCIIPQVRPVLWTRPAAEVVEEIRRLAQHGHREMILTGIHLGHYGLESPGTEQRQTDLAWLIRQILDVPGEFRLRLSSLEASEVTGELLELLAAHPQRLCPHLHIPLQSGAESVLARMRRPWTAQQIVARCRQIRQILDRPALTTDVIVGFPGETEDDFQATCQALQEAAFAQLHVFRFSPRAGTPAATMEQQIPPAVKQRRAAQLIALGQELKRHYAKQLLGRRLQVLVEMPLPSSAGVLLGTADRYLPVQFPGTPDRLDQLVAVEICGIVEDRLVGTGPLSTTRPSCPSAEAPARRAEETAS